LIKRAAELTLGTGARAAELRSAGQPRAAVPTRAETEQRSAGVPSHKSAASLRVIADHSRAATFLISDGVLPSNEGRGYVLRKIIRRASTHGRLIGQTKPFLHEMVFAVRDLMQNAYPERNETVGRVAKTVFAEENRFAHTIDIGLEMLERDLSSPDILTRDAVGQRVYPGERAFKLYDTFGLPFDFIEDVCRD